MRNRRNYYRILQVQPDAPEEIIRACYRTLMRELKQHPDLGGDHWNAAILNEAFEVLSNSEKRDEYDKELFAQYVQKPLPKSSSGKKPLFSFFCPFCKRPLARKAQRGESCPTCRSPLHSRDKGEALNRACRRSAERMEKTETLHYYTDWPQKGQEALMLDLSPMGIRMMCGKRLRKNAVIKLSGPFLKAIAEVKNSHRKESMGKIAYIVGAQFLSVSFNNPKGSFLSTVA